MAQQAAIMGVMNLSKDSFYGPSVCAHTDTIIAQADQMIKDGADIIDIGAEATNPGLKGVSALTPEQECQQVVAAVEAIASRFDVSISVDTSKALVMANAIAAGAHMINDQRALCHEGALAQAVELGVPVCLMHMFGFDRKARSANLDVTLDEIIAFLRTRIAVALEAGMQPENIIIDPGFGHGCYGKNTLENAYMIKHLERFCGLGYKVLVGMSRKTAIGDMLGGVEPDQRLYGSLAAALIAQQNGASIIRVHDVAATKDALKVAACLA